MGSRTYNIQGMDCADCAAKIEKGVARLDGIDNARVDFATSRLIVDGIAPHDLIEGRVKALGYQIASKTEDKSDKPAQTGGVLGFWRYLTTRHETRLALIGGSLVALGLLGSLFGLQAAAYDLLFIIAMIVAGYPIARRGLNNLLINHDFNINLLMTIAGIGAVVIGEPLEGATVVFLFSIGEALEGYTADRARDSLRGLLELAPQQAIRLAHGHEHSVPVGDLTIDDTILVKPGERIAMDGLVIEGASAVNQAPITGESIPVYKSTDAEVFAGTINGEGALKVKVTRLAEDNTLSRIIKLVEEAQSERAPTQRMIDEIAHYYTPLVVIAAVIVALIPPLLFNAPFYDVPGGTHGWLYRALTLLVIACPCALVISSPVTIISAITAAARHGVLIKGGAHLEALSKIKAFAFDKTGTLTRGEPVVMVNRSMDCDTQDNCEDCNDVLALASAVERRSAHPLAKAIVDAAQGRGLSAAYAAAESVESLAGRGVRGMVNGKTVTVGSHNLFDVDYPHDSAFCAMISDVEKQGHTAMLLSDGDRVRGFIAVADSVRADSQSVVGDLKALGNKTVMLTGDNLSAAQAVGREVGVDDVRAGLLPADKAQAIKGLLHDYGDTAMVGDGINDTPAFAAASLGIAMGGAGSAQAMETADIVLMADDLRQLPFAVRLARFARHLILQNVVLSLGMKVVFFALALAGGASLWMAILADVGMSLLVTLNGMRPLRFGRK